MTTFFVRLKSWQLELLMAAIFIVPIVILYTWHFLFAPKRHTQGSDDLVLILRTMGLIAALIAGLFFAWQWTTARYLFGLLKSGDNRDYQQHNAFILVVFILGLIWALVFWTGFINYFAYYVAHHGWVLILIFILLMTGPYFARRGVLFRYKACEALLKGVPYSSVKASYFSHTFNKSWSFPQDEIRHVYLKYGERKVA